MDSLKSPVAELIGVEAVEKQGETLAGDRIAQVASPASISMQPGY